jgi:hypothetical protein
LGGRAIGWAEATDLGVQMKKDADDAEQGRMKRIRNNVEMAADKSS